jgi:hypothetical protein
VLGVGVTLPAAEISVILNISNTKSLIFMMDAQNLQARVDQVESKRAQLLKFQADPNLSSLSLDIDQALIEMDDLMTEFRQTFPMGIVEPPAA